MERHNLEFTRRKKLMSTYFLDSTWNWSQKNRNKLRLSFDKKARERKFSNFFWTKSLFFFRTRVRTGVSNMHLALKIRKYQGILNIDLQLKINHIFCKWKWTFLMRFARHSEFDTPVLKCERIDSLIFYKKSPKSISLPWFDRYFIPSFLALTWMGTSNLNRSNLT